MNDTMSAPLATPPYDADGTLERPKVSVEWLGVERRLLARNAVDHTVMIFLLGGATVTPRAMQNFSIYGAGILLKGTPTTSTDLDLSFDEFRTSFAYRLAWHRDTFAGARGARSAITTAKTGNLEG
ncbi:hypothetical protein QA645_32270 [Bradyrhizobium sp. CIAT3101]|uniref:hypothetical protein n=1 Tax=Bradyrhizobium sp. CIAT3101 TaxID=439387 RepID=UPI0024B19FBB|nr:hypothetical protein [Bradyrhizobium sp. CIAT3101]WFU79173.1 hypothetical protein QA645_32270 [Bradyrhizobium sp. CIAT3101]